MTDLLFAGFEELDRRLRQNLEELACSIGRVVISYNRLERDVGECLARLLGSRSRSTRDILSAGLGMRQRLDVLAALYREHRTADNEVALLTFCLKELGNIEEERNRIVHSHWAVPTFGDTDFVQAKETIRGGKGLKVVVAAADVEKLKLFVERIDIFSSTDLVQLFGVCGGKSTEWSKPATPDLLRLAEQSTDGRQVTEET